MKEEARNAGFREPLHPSTLLLHFYDRMKCLTKEERDEVYQRGVDLYHETSDKEEEAIDELDEEETPETSEVKIENDEGSVSTPQSLKRKVILQDLVGRKKM